jgi:hypothetical protein
LPDSKTNLRVLKPSRKRIKEGDIFAFSVDGKRYFFGRVIRTDVKVGLLPKGILIYLYKASSMDRRQIPVLRKEELLVPPLATNTLPWRRGYFEAVSSEPLTSADVLPRHCFRSVSGRYFDECGNPLESPVEPVGEFSLQSFRTIDDQVSDALEIPTV